MNYLEYSVLSLSESSLSSTTTKPCLDFMSSPLHIFYGKHYCFQFHNPAALFLVCAHNCQIIPEQPRNHCPESMVHITISASPCSHLF